MDNTTAALNSTFTPRLPDIPLATEIDDSYGFFEYLSIAMGIIAVLYLFSTCMQSKSYWEEDDEIPPHRLV